MILATQRFLNGTISYSQPNYHLGPQTAYIRSKHTHRLTDEASTAARE